MSAATSAARLSAIVGSRRPPPLWPARTIEAAVRVVAARTAWSM
jgi:hypothetical protein